jgi:hypothetical protein
VTVIENGKQAIFYGSRSTTQNSGSSWPADLDNVAIWLAQSVGFEFRFIDFIQGHSRACSITYASFSPAPMFAALTGFPGTVVRRLYRPGGQFATR